MIDTPIRLLIVDDHQIVRLGLHTVFASAPGFRVVADVGTVAEAIRAARLYAPDVVLMDIRLPDGSGIEACREIRSERPATRVLMLTSFGDEEAVVAAVMAGASGYLLKRIDAQHLVEAVTTIASGGSLLDPSVTPVVLQRMQRLEQESRADPLAGLNEQERKILPLIAEGKTNREIAAQLCLSEGTVKIYISKILKKLGLSRRSEAAAFITRHSLREGY
jgi:two-component system response regulator DevR